MTAAAHSPAALKSRQLTPCEPVSARLLCVCVCVCVGEWVGGWSARAGGVKICLECLACNRRGAF